METFYKLFRRYSSKDALPYWYILFFDSFVVVFSGIVCYALDHGRFATLHVFWPLVGTLLLYLVFFLFGFRVMHSYSGVLRYSSFSDLYRVAVANLIGVSCAIVLRLFFHSDTILLPIRIKELLFMFILSTILMGMLRVAVKMLHDMVIEGNAVRRVFIYGVKSGGVAQAKAIRIEQPRRFVLKGFVSDADDMVGHVLQGVKVYKNDEQLIEHLRNENVTGLLVSPLKRDRLISNHDMVNRLLEAGITLYTSDLTQEWDGTDEPQVRLREVQIEDLLPREEIHVDLDAVAALLKGRNILITGSAGSIGSEMVRQVASFAPRRMLLIDEAETPQHDIRLMMAREFPDVEAHTIVATITDQKRMEHIFQQGEIDYVFHAAAYKHVPMMEDNPSEAVHNNIIGTRVIADLSVKYGVKKFVMISTDKAVNPTNVMGCSKRICEIYVQSLDRAIKEGTCPSMGQKPPITQFVTTRFGNVLGSNGSVIPLFKQQIKEGGPVTVTHPDIIRYFMLIPEACKLVLEAGTMGKGGEIYVFDMGNPVKIADLARRMILLSGAEGVEIHYTGLRDGEKLYEELLNDKEITKPTFNKKIKIAQVREYDYAEVCARIEELEKVALQFNNMETVRQMKRIVPEYKSQNSMYEALDK